MADARGTAALARTPHDADGDGITPRIARRREAVTIARLTAELEAQAEVLREREAALLEHRATFERASAAARIGLWECDLPGQSLRWSDTVYDIFGLPRGSALSREAILQRYPEALRRALEAKRTRAIEDRTGFTLDVEIVTPEGGLRWIRITATVECTGDVPVRIFGMKQDITEEKLLADRTRYLAEFDVMTGLANRARFQARLAAMDAGDAAGALLLIDLDGFKPLNDTFGHAVGDDCLREAAARLAAICQEADLVARIGGDEFGVLVGRWDTAAIERLAGKIVEGLGRPMFCGGEHIRLGASVGVAGAEGVGAEQLFRNADAALYAAKAAGPNTFRMF